MDNIKTVDKEDEEKLIDFVISMIVDGNPEEVAKNVVKDIFENKKEYLYSGKAGKKD